MVGRMDKHKARDFLAVKYKRLDDRRANEREILRVMVEEWLSKGNKIKYITTEEMAEKFSRPRRPFPEMKWKTA